MDKIFTRQVIEEFFQSGTNEPLNEARLLETTLYIEDSFGITLTDAEITMENLGTAEAALKLVEQKSTEKL